MAVRTRVALFYAFIMAVVLAGASVFLLSRLRADLRSAIDNGLRSRAAIVLRDVNEEFQDVGAHEGVIDESEVIAQILGPRGNVLESTTSLDSASLLSAAEAEALVSKASFDKAVRVRGDSEMSRLYAVRAGNGAIVVVGTSTEEPDEALTALARLLLLGIPIVLVVTSAAVWALTGVALRPVERLRAEAEALSFGIDGHRLPVPATKDEISHLAETLNRMLERLEHALERERRFVDDASHELRTPLAVVKTELELALRKSRSREELEAAIRSAAEEVDALARLAEHLLILARADRGLLPTKPTRVDVAQLVDQVRAGFEMRADDLGIGLRTLAPGPVWAEIDPLLFRQAVSNLVQNALAHTEQGGQITLDVASSSNGLRVTVADSGTGFD